MHPHTHQADRQPFASVLRTIAKTAIFALPLLTAPAQEECYDRLEYLESIDDTQATPHGGCMSGEFADLCGTLCDSQNVSSAISNCKRVSSSYCDGVTYGQANYGSECVQESRTPDMGSY